MAEEVEAMNEEEVDEDEMLVPEDQYLTAGVHIGTQQKSATMENFIFKVRDDGLYVLDVQKSNERIKTVANFLTQYPPERILLVSARQYGKKPIEAFARIMGTMSLAGRFIPGRLTNPSLNDFVEPEVMLVVDPAADRQSVREAVGIGIPIIGLVDTNNTLENIDIALPTNNKGRKALALVFWLLAREMKLINGDIDNRDDFEYEVEDFEQEL